MLLVPPVAAFVFTVFYLLTDEPRLRSKIVVVGFLLAGIFLQFATGYAGTWLLGLVINSGVAIFGILYLQAGSA